METFDRAQLQPKLIELILDMQEEYAQWVPLAKMGGLMSMRGLPYKDYGYLKLRPFLDEFADILEFYEDYDGRTPVYYVRLQEGVDTAQAENGAEKSLCCSPARIPSATPRPSEVSRGATVTPSRYRAELAQP